MNKLKAFHELFTALDFHFASSLAFLTLPAALVPVKL